MAVLVTNGSDTIDVKGGDNYPIRLIDNTLYIVLINSTNEAIEMYKSTNEGVSWSLASSNSYNPSISVPYCVANCLGPDGIIYITFNQHKVSGVLTNDGLHYIPYDPSSDTFGSSSYISSGVNTNILDSYRTVACAISDDITKQLHTVWKSARTTRSLFTENAYYNRTDVSGGGGGSTNIKLRSFTCPHSVLIEKSNSARRPIILASNLSNQSPGSVITFETYTGNTELATSFSRKAGLSTAPKLNTYSSNFNFAEDNEGNHWCIHPEGTPDFNLKYLKHTGTNWTTDYTTGEVTPVSGTLYLAGPTGSFGYGTTRNDKHFLSRTEISTTGGASYFNDYNKHPQNEWNGPSSVESSGVSYVRLRWSNYQHYAPHIIDYIYEKSGDIYYDQKHLNLHI